MEQKLKETLVCIWTSLSFLKTFHLSSEKLVQSKEQFGLGDNPLGDIPIGQQMTSVNTVTHICLFPCFLFSAADSKFSPLGRKGEISVEFQNFHIPSDLKITGRLRHFPDHRARESSKQERAYDTLGSGVILGLPAGTLSLHIRHAGKNGIRRGYQA